jgi:asparagine synthase (glutamine-hydrolysing)
LAEIAIAGRRSYSFVQSDHAIFMRTQVGGDPEPAPICPQDKAGLFVGLAFLHNPQEISASLGLSSAVVDAVLLRKIFEARGDSGLATVRGAFAFAYWDPRTHELTLARDCGRGRSLFFYRAQDFVVFASHLPDLISHRDVPRELDEIVVASFLSHDAYQHRRTFFRDVERVPTRHAVTLTGERIVRRAYWAPQIHSTEPYRRDEDYVDKARELLDRAVARSISDEPNFAVMTSGGLDSPAIVSTLARSGRAQVFCYTIVPEEGSESPVSTGRYADERPKTEALARMYPALRFQYLTASLLCSDFSYSDNARFERNAVPLKNVSRTRFGNRFRAKIAEDGFGVHLGGGAGNFGLTWRGAGLLPFLARNGRYLTLLREASATARKCKSSTARVLARELLLPSLPLSVRRALKRGRSPDRFALYGDTPLKREVVAELDLQRMWDEDGFDPLYPWRSFTPEDRAFWLFDQLQFAHDNFSASPAFRDIELRNPLGDRDLLEFALNVPESLNRRNGVERWFARRVLADRLPPEILHETRRGALQLPWFASLGARREEIAAEVERMENSIIGSRLFDIPRLRHLVSNWPRNAAEAESYGHAYMLSLEQAVHVSEFIRWATKGNA